MARGTDADTRARGAHYLQADGPVVRRLVEAAALRPGETVLDAGAGLGAITQPLCQAVAPGGQVLAVEQKVDLADRLKANHLWPGLRVIAGDVLAVRLPDPLDAVVANPPYRILPALLRRLLAHGFGRAVLVVPEELARRLTAQPKGEDYGKLTVQVASRAKCELLFPVSRRSFDPPPAVASAAVRIVPKAASATEGLDDAMLDAVLDAAWEGRARTLRHALAPLAASLRLPPQDISDAVAMVKGEQRRFADVSPWEFTVLARHLSTCVAARKQATQDGRKERRRQRRGARDAQGQADAPEDPEDPSVGS